jgi:hypothetical protein
MPSSSLRRVIDLLLICFVGLHLSGCREKDKESPTPEAKEKSLAAYEAVLPKANLPAGWKLTGSVKVYPGKKLYDSIDGAADRFFGYDFREQYVAMYASENLGGKIQVEVYDMGTPADAFGIFSCHDNIMSRHTKLGLAAVISEVNLDFCQGEYFTRLLAFDLKEGEAEKTLGALAEAIAENIKPASDFPDLVKRLPEGSVEGTILYFHTWPILNERRYLAEENVFDLSEKTNGVLAAYASEEHKTEDATFKFEKDVLYLIEYPDKEQAQAARTDYILHLQKLVKESRAEGQPPGENLKLIGLPQEPIELYQLYKGEEEQTRLTSIMRVFRNYIFGVWEVTGEEKAKTLLQTLAANLAR